MIQSGRYLYGISLVLLLGTVPVASGSPLMGLPFWVWISLGMTVLYALLLILLIQKKWHHFQGTDDV